MEQIDFKKIIKTNRTLFLFLVLIFVVIGTFFRMQAVDFQRMQFDEFYHISTAQSILDGQEGAMVRDNLNQPYFRGFPVTIITTVSGFFHGEINEKVLIPIAFINSSVSIVLYLLLQRFSRVAGVAAGIIWLFSPLAISMGSYLREYSLFLLFNTVWAFLFINLIKDKNLKNARKIISDKYLITLLIIPILYFLLDFRSTFANIAAVYIGILLFIILHKLDFLSNAQKIFVSALSLIIPFSGMGLVMSVLGREDIFILPSPVERYYEYIFSGSPLFANFINESIQFPISVLFLLVIVIGVIKSLLYGNAYLKSAFYICVAYTSFYGFYFNRYFEERYYIYVTPWLVVLLVIGLYTILELVLNKLLKYNYSNFKVNVLVSSLFLITVSLAFGNFYFFNSSSLQESVVEQKIYHTALLKDYTVLLDLPIEVDENTALITPNEHIILWFYSQNSRYSNYVQFNDNNMYYFQNKYGVISEKNKGVIRNYPKGYFIVESPWFIDELLNPTPKAGKELCKVYQDKEFVVVGWGDTCSGNSKTAAHVVEKTISTLT